MSDEKKTTGYSGTIQVYRRKIDSSGAMESQAFEPEDQFKNYYVNGNASTGSPVLLKPPYDPVRLRQLVQENNTLSPCISAMEVNVDGTGQEVIPVDDEAGDTEWDLAEAMGAIFEEPYPNESFLSQRKAMRVDMEATGNAYLEVIRNLKEEIVFLRPIFPENIRLVALDKEFATVTKKVKRNGVELEVKVRVRERMFAQLSGDKLVYFAEYGSSRKLDRNSGKWSDTIAPEMRATEVIHFLVDKDSQSPYGIPRWISQLPSVLGQRAAEELNLEFFNSGGIPPIIVSLVGGQFTQESKDLIAAIFGGGAKTKMGAAVLEAVPTGGSIDKEGKAEVKFERFGAEGQKDAMFEVYDDKCEIRIRKAFRMPPIFIGKTQDYTYATAFASYVVAEEQVFSPERKEFDDKLNTTLMRDPSMGGGLYKIVSNPLTVKDITIQMQILQFALTQKAITNEEYIDQVNTIASLGLEYSGIEPSEFDPMDLLGAIGSNLDEEGNIIDDTLDEDGNPLEGELDEDGNPVAPKDGELEDDVEGKTSMPTRKPPKQGGKAPFVAKKALARRVSKAKGDIGRLIVLSSDVTRLLTEHCDERFKALTINGLKGLSKRDLKTVRTLVSKELLVAGMSGNAAKLLEKELDL